MQEKHDDSLILVFLTGQGFADKRKKKIQYEYRKMLHKEKKNAAANDAGSKEADIHKFDGKKQFRYSFVVGGVIFMQLEGALSNASVTTCLKMLLCILTLCLGY